MNDAVCLIDEEVVLNKPTPQDAALGEGEDNVALIRIPGTRRYFPATTCGRIYSDGDIVGGVTERTLQEVRWGKGEWVGVIEVHSNSGCVVNVTVPQRDLLTVFDGITFSFTEDPVLNKWHRESALHRKRKDTLMTLAVALAVMMCSAFAARKISTLIHTNDRLQNRIEHLQRKIERFWDRGRPRLNPPNEEHEKPEDPRWLA